MARLEPTLEFDEGWLHPSFAIHGEAKSMTRYLIQESHEPEECVRTIDAYFRAGAHFLTRSDWGCEAGVHRSWLIVEAENDEQARLMIPPAIRAKATLTPLNKFTPREIEKFHQRSNHPRAKDAAVA